MPAASPSVFALPEHLSAKRSPDLIGEDERHLAGVLSALAEQRADLAARQTDALQRRAAAGQDMVERDQEVRRVSARLRMLGRFGLDLCLGWMQSEGSSARIYIGRLGLLDAAGRRLLIDWRTPAAEPFFAATRARPMGLTLRRRYRFTGGRVSDYWDEVFDAHGTADRASLDAESAFVASLAGARSAQMRDVLGTIAADQDAVIRADARGALVVDGGPGTGKTVVALHRTAYLMYADAQVRGRGRGVLFVGPHQPYLAYIDDVLPSLGEDGVRTCTLRDLVPEGAAAMPETDSAVAALKEDARMSSVVEPLMRLIERPPWRPYTVETEWVDVPVLASDWAEAFDSAELGASHNEARPQVWEALTDLLAARCATAGAPRGTVRRQIAQDAGLRARFDAAWPVAHAEDLIAQLWTDPRLLAAVAPWLDERSRGLLSRSDGRRWTLSDLPLLDAVRMRVGDPRTEHIARVREAVLAEEREVMDRTVAYLLGAHELDDGEGVAPMLRGEDLRTSLVDEERAPDLDVDPLAGPFTHIVVDEAQELSDAQWQMLLRRCPSRSFTIAGDRAQARHGFPDSWTERLARVGVRHVTQRELSVNYRTPAEVMAVAEPVIRAVLPDANVPTAIRRGAPVVRSGAASLEAVLGDWLGARAEGVAVVIAVGADLERAEAVLGALEANARVKVLAPELVKGLEFDLVVLMHPDRFGTGITGAVDTYVAMTRATERLIILGH